MILTTILVFLSSLTFYVYIKSIIILRKSNLPSLPVYPIIGHLPHFLGIIEGTDLVKTILKMSERFIGSLGVFIGTHFLAILYNPEDITLLINDTTLQRKSKQYGFLKPAIGEGILVSSGAQYRQSKKILVEAVSASNMKVYMRSFNKHSRLLVESIKSKVDKEEFRFDETISFYIFKNLLETIMGLESHNLTDGEIFRYNENIAGLTRCVFQRTCTIWLYPDFLFKMSKLYRKQQQIILSLHAVTDKLIMERREKIENFNNTDGIDQNVTVFIDKFFTSKTNKGEAFTIPEIRGDVLALLGAGLETTAVSLGFLIMLLSIHQDVQQKVYEEIINKLGNADEDVCIEDVQQLKYMDQVINENWRLYSPLPAIGRDATHDVELSRHRSIQKDSTVCISMALLHRNPNVYSNPNKFDPDNFSPEKVKERPLNCFIPFGVGSRKCIGGIFAKTTIKTMLVHLLRNYVFHTTKTEEDFQLSLDITLKNKSGTMVSVKKRKQ